MTRYNARTDWTFSPHTGTAAFIDAEHALDPVYAKNLGVNVDDLLVCQVGLVGLFVCVWVSNLMVDRLTRWRTVRGRRESRFKRGGGSGLKCAYVSTLELMNSWLQSAWKIFLPLTLMLTFITLCRHWLSVAWFWRDGLGRGGSARAILRCGRGRHRFRSRSRIHLSLSLFCPLYFKARALLTIHHHTGSRIPATQWALNNTNNQTLFLSGNAMCKKRTSRSVYVLSLNAVW